jgi:hypothetical protein
MPFTKLDDGLIFSSILREDDAVFKIWMLILSRTGPDGIARISSDFLVSVTRKSDEEVWRCLTILEAPDRKSRSTNDDGRRIRRVDGGFEVINYLKYRQSAEKESIRAYERDRKREQRADVPGVSGTETGLSASASVSVSKETEELNKADRAIGDERRSLECRLGAALTHLAEHENSRLMQPAWCKKVTGYEKNGKSIGGVMDYRARLSLERLEKSIADAKWWLKEMDGGRVVDGS